MARSEIRKALRTLAKKHGTAPAKIRAEMQLAIKLAYMNPSKGALAIPRKGAIPTIEEFIEYNRRKLSKEE